MNPLGIKEISQEDDRTLLIHWNNGKKNTYDTVNLRKKCPCALCVDENTGKQKLDPLSIKETTRPIKIKSVGNYALSISFDDGHRTGIYTYKKLSEELN